jgi:hypothetical protein
MLLRRAFAVFLSLSNSEFYGVHTRPYFEMWNYMVAVVVCISIGGGSGGGGF